MKLIESMAMALATFVAAGLLTGLIGGAGLVPPGTPGLVVWIAAQSVVTALLLWAIPRRPVTYASHDAERNDTRTIDA